MFDRGHAFRGSLSRYLLPPNFEPGLRLRLRRGQTGAQTQRDQFNFPSRVVMSVTALMFGVEARGDVVLILVIPVLGGGQVEFVALTAIPQVKTPFKVKCAAPPFRAEFLLRRRLQLAKLLLQLCPRYRLRCRSPCCLRWIIGNPPE